MAINKQPKSILTINHFDLYDIILLRVTKVTIAKTVPPKIESHWTGYSTSILKNVFMKLILSWGN